MRDMLPSLDHSTGLAPSVNRIAGGASLRAAM
jgi:hypothetical protein